MDAHLHQLRPPASCWEARCSIPGCRWRVYLPISFDALAIGQRLASRGWGADDEGMYCGRHSQGPIDA